MTRMIIFDLDGTISDSWPGMLYSYKQTFREFGREDMPDDEFYSCFVGNLTDNLAMMLHIEGDDLKRAVKTYRKYYTERGHSLSNPFDNILHVIRNLKDSGYVLCVATMKLERFAVDTIEELGVSDCFTAIKGTDEEGERSKTDMIRMCMDITGISKEDTVMIGDGFNDQAAAKKANVGFIAATYGYGITKENCEEYNVECASSPTDILRAVEEHWQE